MFVVLFEVRFAPGKKDEYLELARYLKPRLEAIDGFIDNERFHNKKPADWILSLSTWRDEKALVCWRTEGEHRMVQEKARNGIFADYHLRVCEVTADSHPPRGLPVIEQRFDITSIGEATALAITETIQASPAVDKNAAGLIESEMFDSIYTPGKSLLLTSWKTPDDCARWTPRLAGGIGELRHRRVRNIRDYGMFDRREAPQYYPDERGK